MAPLDHITLLSFRLPSFCRISWVSRQAGETWAPRFQAINDCREALLPLALREGIYPLGLFIIYPHEEDALLGQFRDCSLKGRSIALSAACLSDLYPAPFPDDPKRIFLLIGEPPAVESAIDAAYRGDLEAYHAAFGLPESCIWQVNRARAASLQNPFLPWAWGGEAITSSARMRIIGEQNTFNILLRRLGLDLLFHLPARPECPYSREIASQMQAAARKAGFHQEMEWLAEILSWPVSWSVLHGIAEIKTPVMKATMDCDPTAEKYEVQYHGSGWPAEGAQGLGFPYRQPPRRYFSDSEGFRRGLENPTP